MKKTFKTMLALMAGAMTFTGCTSDILENTPEQIPSAFKPMTFTATQEGDATRAAIDASDGVSINWTENDAISIFDGVADEDGNLAREFVLTNGAGSTSGTFDGTAKEGAEAYYALYPCVLESVYQVTEGERDVDFEDIIDLDVPFPQVNEARDQYWMEGGDVSNYLSGIEGYDWLSDEDKALVLAYIKGEKIKSTETTEKGVQHDGDNFTKIVLPAEQTATAGSADPKAMLMIGKSTDASTIEFKNVCAYVKVTPQFDCKKIAIQSNGTESLAGTLTVNYNNGTPTTTVTANGTNTIHLNGTIAEKSTYYIAVRPETLTSGFTIVFTTTDGSRYKKSTSKEVGLARSQVLNLGKLGISNLTSIVTTGTAERTGDIEVNWVQLWENGPKFAEYNVGATSSTDVGGYFTWGGTYANGEGITWTDDHNTGTSELFGDTDTATKLWGSNWRMPTSEDLQALINNSNVQWTGSGYIFTGKSIVYEASSLFLPAAGYCDDDGLSGKNRYGNYMSSTPSDNYYEKYLRFFEGDRYMSTRSRNEGISVRAVLAE